MNTNRRSAQHRLLSFRANPGMRPNALPSSSLQLTPGSRRVTAAERTCLLSAGVYNGVAGQTEVRRQELRLAPLIRRVRTVAAPPKKSGFIILKPLCCNIKRVCQRRGISVSAGGVARGSYLSSREHGSVLQHFLFSSSKIRKKPSPVLRPVSSP